MIVAGPRLPVPSLGSGFPAALRASHSARYGSGIAHARTSVASALSRMRAKAAASSAITLIPERAFYQLQDKYRENTEMREIIETLLSEERT